jgi:histidinol-phosphatase
VTEWDADLALAHRLADSADALSMSRFLAADLVVEAKPDLTPVTDADRAVEQAMRQQLERDRPADEVLGEEYGVTGDSARRWVIDPIDGTKNFVRGVPVWATLIALQHNETTVVGVVSAPALGRRWWASRGGGAWTGAATSTASGATTSTASGAATSTASGAATSTVLGDARACRVSKVGALEDASLSYSSPGGWREHGRLPEFLALLDRVWRSRAYGDFWSHMLVAEGAVDASCEPELSLWDIAALLVIVSEAGGRVSNLSGVDRADGGSLLCSNGLLHEDLLAALSPAG